MLKLKKIQKIKTPDGHMIPIYRNWDHETNEGHEPKMVYATTIEPGIEKDIILHERRVAYMTCVQGVVELEAYVDNTTQLFTLNSEEVDGNIDLAIVPANVPIKLSNVGQTLAVVINCPSPSWHPTDPDTIKFKNWSEFKKWKNA